MKDLEIETMKKISGALATIKDEATRGRILNWALEKFGAIEAVRHAVVKRQSIQKGQDDDPGDEILGVAKRTENGIEITIRDLKAKNLLNAALRLALVSIYSYEKLAGERGVSSRKFLTPLLREWRLYDGNVRPMLANYRGILRDGDQLTLDSPARREAEKFIDDIQNEEVVGKWNPNKPKRRKAKPKVKL